MFFEVSDLPAQSGSTAFGIPEINVNAISYFAASMFWRGSIHPWNEDGTYPVSLGPFQEQFRQYLMELQPFPKDCALWGRSPSGKGNRSPHLRAVRRASGQHPRLQIPHTRTCVPDGREQGHPEQFPRLLLCARAWKPAHRYRAARKLADCRRRQDARAGRISGFHLRKWMRSQH